MNECGNLPHAVLKLGFLVDHIKNFKAQMNLYLCTSSIQQHENIFLRSHQNINLIFSTLKSYSLK